MTQARLELDEYTTRVLDIFKGRYGLKNREDALNRFVKEFGIEFLEPSINEESLFELDKIVETHEKNHKNRTMSLDELDKLLEL